MYMIRNNFIEQCSASLMIAGQICRPLSSRKDMQDAKGRKAPSPHIAIKDVLKKKINGNWTMWTEGKGVRKISVILCEDIADFDKLNGVVSLTKTSLKKPEKYVGRNTSTYKFKFESEAYKQLVKELGSRHQLLIKEDVLDRPYSRCVK